jgi:hypothetical protein
MGFFRKKHRESADPSEDVAEEDGATPHRGSQGFPTFTESSRLPDGAGLMGDEADPLSRKRNRADADPEDDTAESQLIDEERRREEY